MLYMYIWCVCVYTNVTIYYINCRKSLRERRRNGMESRRAGLRADRKPNTRVGIYSEREKRNNKSPKRI